MNYRRLFRMISGIDGVTWIKKPTVCWASIDAVFMLGHTRFQIQDCWADITIESCDPNPDKMDMQKILDALNNQKWRWWWSFI